MRQLQAEQHSGGSRKLIAAVVMLSFLLADGALAAAKYWIGPASGSFAADAHWSLSSGGGNDTTAPGSSDVAVFDDGGAADCSIDSGITVQGLEIHSGYSGSITQYAGASIGVGTSGYAQADGSFAGGNADLTTEYFTLSGGAFTAPAGTLNIQNTSGGSANKTNFTWTGGTFSHNGGTLRFRTWLAVNSYPIHTINLNGGSLTVNNLIVTGGNYPAYGRHMTYSLGAADKFIVEGDLTLEGDVPASQYATLYLSNGVIEVHGNLTVNPGILGGTTAVKLVGAADQTYTYTGGTNQNSIEIDKTAGSVSPAPGTTDFPAKALTLTLADGAFIAPAGLFEASTSYVQNDGVFTPGAGDVSVGSFTLNGGTFTAPTGIMAIACTTAGATDVFALAGGTFNHNGGTLRFSSWFSSLASIIHGIVLNGTLTVNNLEYTGGNTLFGATRYVSYSLGAADKFIVEGNLLLGEDWDRDPDALSKADNGSIELYGNLTVIGTPAIGDSHGDGPSGTAGGSTVLKLLGDADQTYTYTGGIIQDALEIDKTGGSVTPGLEGMDFPAKLFTLTSGEFTAPGRLFSASSDYVQNGGVFIPGTGDVSVQNFHLNDGTFTAPAGTMSVTNTYTGSRTIFKLAGGQFIENNVSMEFRSWVRINSYWVNTIDLGGTTVTVSNLVFSGGNWMNQPNWTVAYALGADDTLVVRGNLLMESDMLRDTNAKIRVDADLDLHGDLAVNPGVYGGAASIRFFGDRAQSLTQTGGTPPTNLWTLDKSGGSLSLATDFSMSGKTQDLSWVRGTLNLNSNVLSVGRNVTVDPGTGALGVTVADAAAAGRLVVTGALTGIEKLDLNVAVTATTEETAGRSYVILSNNTPLAAQFAAVKWPGAWRGEVDYTGNGGREAMLFNLQKSRGTKFIFR